MTMRDVILSQPEQIRHSLEVNKDVTVTGSFDSIVLAGLGGSGHPGDLLNALDLPTIPLSVHRGYGLPTIYGNEPLVIASSYSGNTEETLSAYTAAQENGYALLVNTAGGTLEEWSKRDHVPMTKIDFPGMQPRHTLFASFTGLYCALKNSKLVKDITDDLLRVAKALETTIPTLENVGKDLAKKLEHKTPVFMAGSTLAFAAKNFKIQTNENVKTPAFWNEFPELNHNEMIGFEHPQALFHAVILRDADDHPRVKARMDVTAELYQKWGVRVTSIDITGKSVLEKIFSAVVLGLWTTYFMAESYGIDPVPVHGVEGFKKRLKEVAGEV